LSKRHKIQFEGQVGDNLNIKISNDSNRL
jgi:hypothetical protein